MKKLIIAAATATMALSACDVPEQEDVTIIEEEPVKAEPCDKSELPEGTECP